MAVWPYVTKAVATSHSAAVLLFSVALALRFLESQTTSGPSDALRATLHMAVLALPLHGLGLPWSAVVLVTFGATGPLGPAVAGRHWILWTVTVAPAVLNSWLVWSWALGRTPRRTGIEHARGARIRRGMAALGGTFLIALAVGFPHVTTSPILAWARVAVAIAGVVAVTRAVRST